jgi:hypothetical protein
MLRDEPAIKAPSIATKTEPRAVLAMVLGLGAIYLTFTGAFGLELSLVALALGIWALLRIRDSNGHLVGTWFAVAGMVSPLISAGYFVLQLAVVSALLLLSPHSGTVSHVQFGHNQSLYLDAGYADSVGITAAGNADVPDGTEGQLQVTGPLSWTCPGKFVSHGWISPDAYMNLPSFKVGDATDFQFWGPRGRYTLTLTIPSFQVKVSSTVSGGGIGQGAPGNWSPPSAAGCIPSA